MKNASLFFLFLMVVLSAGNMALAVSNDTYTVTFSPGNHGTITSGTTPQTVSSGGSATAPTITPFDGWRLTGWDTDFSNVTSDLTVTAQYIELFTVTFLAGEHGTLSGTTDVTVDTGTAATAPMTDPDANYHFVEWDVAFDNVTSDLTVTASFAIDQFTVTFVAGEHGSLTGETVRTVDYGTAATAPVVTPATGYHSTGWDTDFSNVTSDLTVTAQYAINTYTVTFDPAPGAIASGEASQTIEHGSAAVEPTVTPVTGYHLTGWDTDFSNVTSDLTVTAQYAINTYTVTFDPAPGTIASGEASQTIEHGSAAVEPTVIADFKYDFIGWSCDPNSSALNNITADTTITALYSYGIGLGSGTTDDPYVVTTRGGLEAVNDNLSASYVIGKNVDLSGVIYGRPLIFVDPNTPFTGTINGNYHTITGLTIDTDGASYAGLVGYLGNGASVTRLNLKDCNIGGGNYCGAVAGYCFYSDISECSVSGSVSGADFVGGFVGRNGGTIKNCFSTCTVRGNSSVGGFAGFNSKGKTINCYSTGSVTGSENAGGFVGNEYKGNLEDEGVETIVNCFWLEGAFGDPNEPVAPNSLGEMKTAEAMSNSDTFTGWDFYDNTDGTWGMLDGFPVLRGDTVVSTVLFGLRVSLCL